MRTKGFSLVELLVVIGVSSILLTALATLFVSQSRTYSVYSDAGETQQAGKIVLDYIAKEIRMAGSGIIDKEYMYQGTSNVFLHLSSINSNTGPDAIRMRGNFQGIFGNLSTIGTGIGSLAAAIPVVYKDRATFSAGNYITVNDGSKSEAFLVTAVSADKSSITIQSTTNSGHSNGVIINGIQQLRYFLDNGVLYRNNFEGNSKQPMLENVEDLQFQYGIDSNGDGTVDQWLDDIAGKERLVRAVKIWMIVRGTTVDPNINDTKSYVMGSRTFVPAASARQFHRYLFTTTVELRNYYFGS